MCQESTSRLDRIVHRLLVDHDFREKFAENPETASREYALCEEELSALTAGNEAELLALGLDESFVNPPAPARPLVPGLLASGKRRLVGIAALAMVFLGAAAPPAVAARRFRISRVRAGRSGRLVVHIIAREATSRRSARVRESRVYFPTRLDARAFSGTLGSYSDVGAVLSALQTVDGTIINPIDPTP